MPTLLIYLLQASMVLTVLYGLYWVLLRKQTFYQLNRIVLLGAMCCALLLPAIRVRLPQVTAHSRDVLASGAINSAFDKFTTARVPTPDGSSGVAIAPKAAKVDRKQAIARKAIPAAGLEVRALAIGKGLLSVYLLVAAFFAGKIIVELLALRHLIRKGSRQKAGSCVFVHTKECIAPLSFFKLIVLNPDLYNPTQLQQIVRHERVHAQQWHSLDVLAVEIFGALFWFHPLAWLLKKEVKLNLEYIADRQVLREGANRKQYQYHLLQISAPTAPIRAVTYFNFSHLKNRIAQMNLPPSSRQVLWRYGVLLPAVALLLLIIQPMRAARTVNAQTFPERTVAQGSPAVNTQPSDYAESSPAGEPGRSQPAGTESVTLPTSPVEASTAQPTGREATRTELTTPAQPDRLLTPDQTSSAELNTDGKEADRQLASSESTGIEPANTQLIGLQPLNIRTLPDQTTTASALTPYLKLEANQSIYLAIRASLSENDLESTRKHLQEKGVQVTFTNVTYNTDNRLTRIQLQVSIGNCTAGACFAQTIEAYNGGEPLRDDKPLVFYLSRRIDKVGVSYGYPQELTGNDLSALQHITGSMIGNYGGG